MVRTLALILTVAHPGDPALTGSRLPKPRRIALLLLFAFEVVINIILTVIITIITLLTIIITIITSGDSPLVFGRWTLWRWH